MKRFLERIKISHDKYKKEIISLKQKVAALEDKLRSKDTSDPEDRATSAYGLFVNSDFISDCFEMGPWNQNGTDTFVVLKRVKPGPDPVNRELFHHTCNAYLIVKPDNSVYIGSYAKTSVEVDGKRYKTRLVGVFH